ncbi:MAG: cyclic peptide export ABC transporter [SAR324 cluster bacterium]|nr:cyclic peptide export ABC transporter [SAR324 cluster bacterium]
MEIIKLLRRFSPKMVNHITFMIFFTGVINAIILSIICAVAVSPEKNSFRFFMLYLGALVIFLISKKYGLIKAAVLAETAVSDVRMRIIDKLRHANLMLVEDLGRAFIHTRLTKDTMEVSMGFGAMIHTAQAAVMVMFAILFLGFISIPIFLMTLGIFAICGMIYYASEKKVEALVHASTQKETELFGFVNHMLDGFQELRMNQSKSDDLYNHYLSPASEQTTDLKIKFFFQLTKNLILSLSFVHVLIISIIFVLPRYIVIPEPAIIQSVAIIFYVVGPFNHILGSISIFSRTTVAIENLYRFEEELNVEDDNYISAGNSELAEKEGFQQLQLSNFQFHYKDPEGNPSFSVGPCDLTINSNEILFIVGGNGSGKSTFLKLLTGLYYPMEGSITLDEIRVGSYNYPDYRNLFSIIFTDFHLFDRLYGLKGIEPSKVNQLLRLMEIDNKTRFVDGGFSNINLSTGQKKRLALVAALLEDKKIYVLDEVAADQDPQFRKYFYETILPDLKKQGKTIIAATHDDKYFHVADRVLKMEYGQFIPYAQD